MVRTYVLQYHGKFDKISILTSVLHYFCLKFEVLELLTGKSFTAILRCTLITFKRAEYMYICICYVHTFHIIFMILEQPSNVM